MKQFRAWDSEAGKSGELRVLQNSDELKLTGDPFLSIRTPGVLEALSDNEKVNVWFSFSYDVNMLFRNESRDVRKALFIEPEHTIQIGPYKVTYMNKKILRVNKGLHYDTWGFFQSSFEKALKNWNITAPDIISKGKEKRSSLFEGMTDQEVEAYNLAECKLLVELMNKLQVSLEKVGYGDIEGYHGAGAIAAKMLDNLKAKEYMGNLPRDALQLKKDAYFGGRIEIFKRGEYSPIYNYDINSAYPSATRELPNLHKIKWRKVSGERALDYDFGIVNVSWKPAHEWDCNCGCKVAGPFPYRGDYDSDYDEDSVIFPIVFSTYGSGAYHLVEVREAVKRGFWKITIGEGYVIDNGYEQPFYDSITELMKERLKLKKAKDFANIPLKLGANSFYGKFAQFNRDKKMFGFYHNLIYAGYITAWTRAQLLKYMNPNGLILCATDGIYSTVPLDCPIGEGLGEWEYEPYKNGRFILPGIYKIDDTTKTRGIPKSPFDKDSQLFDWIFAQSMLRTTCDSCAAGICRIHKIPELQYMEFVPNRKSLKQYRKYPRCGFYQRPKKIDIFSEVKRQWHGNDDSVPSETNQKRSKPFEYDLGKGNKRLDEYETEELDT